LKSVLTIIPKLSDRTINGELLKYLAKTANDEQPGIRTNTTICLGKMAKHLSNSTRAKVLIAAFTRSLRDPFVHARNASLMALAVTSEYFSDEDCANRILPSMCPLLIDKEKLVRDQVSKTIDVYLQKIRKAASAMPDTVLPPPNISDGSAPRMSTPQPTESASASWAGWAISSFTNKLSAAAGEIEANGAATPKPAPSPGLAPSRPAGQSSASTLHRQAVKSPPAMSRTPSSAASHTAALFHDDNNAADDGTDAWGDMGDDDGFFDAPEDERETFPKKSPPASSIAYDDGGEPDFAGWLAAQSQKKSGGKPLPKGLAKSKSPTSGALKSTSSATRIASSSKAAPAKKIDMKPKETDMDGDAWGDDGW